VLDLFLDLVRIGLWQVHLVQHRHHFQALFDRRVAVGYRLRLDALASIDYQQRTLARGQRATDFIGEVDVAGRIDEIQLVGLAIARSVIKRDAVGFDGDAALALEIHRIQHLGFHFTLGQTTTHLDKTVCQGRLAVIDMGDDGKIADMTQVTHSSTLGIVAGRLPAENSREV